MIIHSKSKVKNKILPTYGCSLTEFSNTSYGIVGVERIKDDKIGSKEVSMITKLISSSSRVKRKLG